MIKSAMRQALREGLMKAKNEGQTRRARAYIGGEGDEDERNDSDDEGPGADSSGYDGDLAQGDEEELRRKVDDAEEDAMDDLEAAHPSEREGSPEEEMSESAEEAAEEGDPEEYRDEDYWREEASRFMKGKSTAKSPRKTASIIAVVGKKPTNNGKSTKRVKIDPPFQPQSQKTSMVR